MGATNDILINYNYKVSTIVTNYKVPEPKVTSYKRLFLHLHNAEGKPEAIITLKTRTKCSVFKVSIHY